MPNYPVVEEVIKPEKSYSSSNGFFSKPTNDQTNNNNDEEEFLTGKLPRKLGGWVNSSFGKHGDVVEQVGKEAFKLLPTKTIGFGIINPVGLVNQAARTINDIRKKTDSKRSGSPVMNPADDISKNFNGTGEDNKDGISKFEDLDKNIKDKLNSSMENIQIADRLKSGNVLNTACVSHPSVGKETHDSGVIHIEMSVDPVFKSEQISVKFESNRIIITGRHDEEQSPGDFVEFKKSFEITQAVDQSSPTVQISGATLIVEAPIIENKN